MVEISRISGGTPSVKNRAKNVGLDVGVREKCQDCASEPMGDGGTQGGRGRSK